MIILEKTTTVLQAVLAGAVSANQPEAIVSFVDENVAGQDTKYGTKRALLNGNTDVTVCDAPRETFVRNINTVTIFNDDTATVTVTLKIDDGGTEYILIQQALLTKETLSYEHGAGYQIL